MSDGAGEAGNDVGGLAEEAARLLEAFQGWARESAATHVIEGQECAWCPLCQALHRLRETSPEVRAHLAAAASSLLQAAAGLLASPVPNAGHRQPGVHKIELDDDDAAGQPGWDAD